MFAPQFVVRQKYKGFVFFNKFIAHAAVGMIEVDGNDFYRIDLKIKAAFHVVIDAGLQGVELYGEQRGAHGFAEQFSNISLCGGTTHQVN